MSAPAGDRPALLLAAHGAGDGSAANQRLRELARSLVSCPPFARVTVAFKLGRPGFGEALEALSGRVVVVPVMTSDGYFARTVLAGAVTQRLRRGDIDPTLTPALGTHPGIEPLAATRVAELVDRRGLDPQATTLLVVGHGTGRSRASAESTRRLAAGLAERRIVSRIEAAFLDDEPPIERVAAATATRHLVALPFLIGGGGHALEDLPRRLEAARQGGAAVIAPPLGSDPAIAGLIRDRAIRGLLRRQQAA